VTAALAVAAGVAGVALAPLLDLLATRIPREPVAHPVPARRAVFAVGGGVLLAAAGGRFADSWALPAYLVFAAGMLLLSVIDVERFLLPDLIVYPLGLLTAGLLGVAALADDAGGAWMRALAAGAIAGAAFALLHLLFPAGLAAGDVKLAVVLGLATGWLGGAEVFLAFTLAFVLGAVVSAALVLLGRRHRRDPVPFGPFLAGGALTAVLVGPGLLDWYAGS
jgi:leader peptidase (prepilin peptidase) / N-methyltransferase